ncbi:LysM peptidoglycan-binding domain-containing protein [Streptococcus anginosus]|uniref:LysM peptidoglycan-binding domain-containing protein n=1 Tax=Streptococcus anginosus TaxID=1328 RepID=A0ABD4U227_STRAP|nr:MULTISPECIES: LysM peptidoglycan-binding domain-containing protein [Streptococcus]KAA9297780.1 LysM peptidoglycan-binding domain-containing protein [Streptococcus anginosus]KUM00351.1 peptidoglycan-binding protein LysM [Streptococcus anginosus]MCW1075858.1 LysM peptidoglycan-binding domain-containing protein [Streptococcus anginosus]MDB8654899.1 LysM peptidoglycan-binding domain-containing protein [Streptococcus anginosus]MDB8658554.1 LysM peptidoglycan-binding domain-containing protein [St
MILNLKNTNKKMKVGLMSLAATALFFLPTLANADSYTVKSGDTLSAIAASHNTTVDKIAQKNKISNIHLISVGQVLELDDTATSTTTAESSNSATTTSGLSAEDAAAKEWIAQKESSGSYTAQNGQYYGRYQLSLSYLNGDLSAENQEKVADAYVAGRYGSWSAAKTFWLANGWY